MKILQGKQYAQDIITHLKTCEGLDGFVAAFLEEGDDVQKSFLAQKKRVAEELGIDMRSYTLPTGGNDHARAYIRQIVSSKKCKGALIQLPLKENNGLYLAQVIPQQKDIDVLSSRSYGDFAQGRGSILPPAVRTLQYILHKEGKKITDIQSVAVIGQGRLVGKPLSLWLSQQVPECLCLDKGYRKELLTHVDLIISATGDVGSLDPSYIPKGVWVIDFGYGIREGKIQGDLAVEKGVDHLGYYTPTPGGTGPLLVSAVFENLFVAHNRTSYEDTLT